jgi:hypothetical protein
MNSTPQIASLHAVYTGMTQLRISLDMGRIFQWDCWLAKGFTESDLRAVIIMLKAKNKAGGKYSLNFSRIIRDADWFDELRAEATAKAREVKLPSARAAVLRATGRSDAPAMRGEVSVSQVALQLLRDCRANL